MDKRGKTTDSLMRHIRDKHHININGSKDKKDLLAMGYFHGYKAYRFLRTKKNTFHFNNFDEIKSIYDFDNSVKTLLYPMVMQLETILKNYTIDAIVSGSSVDVNSVIKNTLNYENEVREQKKEYIKAIERKLRLKMKINSIIYHSYKNSLVIQHYLNAGEPIPIWAVFENMTLGDYGTLVQCLGSDIRIKIEDNIGIKDIAIDTDGLMLAKDIFIIKDLRNAIAHNNIVFDCRFKRAPIRKTIFKIINKKTGVENIRFESIIDYFVLLIFFYKNLKTPKRVMLRIIRDLNISIKMLKNNVNPSIYPKILGSDDKRKIQELKNYVQE